VLMSECFSSIVCPVSYRTFFRELLLLTGISSHGVGNWKKIAEHVGTRTKEEVDEHYRKVYINSKDWPIPVSVRAI